MSSLKTTKSKKIKHGDCKQDLISAKNAARKGRNICKDNTK
jgi:hypothetical protein